MRSFTSIAAAAVLTVAVNGQATTEIDGNYYTNQVDTIQYTNFGSSGSYNAVTNMDSSSGQCSSSATAYSGSLAPLNGQVWMRPGFLPDMPLTHWSPGLRPFPWSPAAGPVRLLHPELRIKVEARGCAQAQAPRQSRRLPRAQCSRCGRGARRCQRAGEAPGRCLGHGNHGRQDCVLGQ